MTLKADFLLKTKFQISSKRICISQHCFPINLLPNPNLHLLHFHMSHLVGKPTICIGENKDADQLRGNREADQRLCFHYSDSTIPPLLNSKISSFKPASVLVQVGLCRTWSETTLLVFPRGGSIIILIQSA